MLAHILGLDDAGGGWYLFWSGFGADLPMFASVALMARRLNCHQQGCWRIGLTHHSGLHLCAKHRKGSE